MSAVDELSLCDAIMGRRPIETIRAIVQARPGSVQENYDHKGYMIRGYRPLHVAIRFSENPDLVRLLADAGPEALEVEGRDDYCGSSCLPLELAAWHKLPLEVITHLAGKWPPAIRRVPFTSLVWGSSEVVRFFAEARPCFFREKSFRTERLLLLNAVREGSAEKLRILASAWPRGARVRDSFLGHVPLHVAATRSVDVVKAIFEAWPRGVRAKDDVGCVPLHWAVEYWTHRRGLEVVRFLASAWPDALRTEDHNGSLPLHYALRRGEVELAQVLASMDPNVQPTADNEWWPLLHHAARHGSLKAVQPLTDMYPLALLRPQGGGWYPLHLAAEREDYHLDVVQFLAEKWPRALREKTASGWLPLHIAAKGSSMRIVEFLSRRRPQALLERTDDGLLPLHVALKFARWEVARFLADEGSQEALQAPDSSGRLPLHHAVAHCQAPPELVLDLTSAWPCALHRRSNDGRTPLHIAAQCGATSGVLQFLARAGPISLQAPFRDGTFPIHRAIECIPWSEQAPWPWDTIQHLGDLYLEVDDIEA
jgi:ankyrin repeat protein